MTAHSDPHSDVHAHPLPAEAEEDWLSDDNVDVAGAERVAEQLRQEGTSLPEEAQPESQGRAKPKQTWTFSSSGWVSFWFVDGFSERELP